MRTPRQLLPLAFALAVVAGCARCGGTATPPPVERFIAADSAAVLVVPTLQGFARQSSELLATAGSFPFGMALRDARSVIAGRVTFDPFDAAAIGAAGLDPARGLALFGRVGERGPNSPDVILSLPVGDSAKLEATIATIAKDRLGASERTVEAGSPEVVAWRMGAGGPIAVAFAVVERTALLSSGDAAVAAIRAAASVPAGGTLASVSDYQKSVKALGDELAARFYVPPGSPAIRELAQFKDGVSFGLRGGKELLGMSAAMPLGAREAALKAAVAGGSSAALLGQLDPSSLLLFRGEGGSAGAPNPAELSAALAMQGIPPAVGQVVAEFLRSVGNSSAMGLSLVPQRGKPAALQSEPLKLVSAEVLVALADPAGMTATIQGAVDSLAAQAKGGRGKLALGKNPWRFPVAGGEVAAAVKDGKLAIAVGPAKALEALLARRGSSFKGPTAASDRALKAGTGGMYVDVPRLAAGVKALPESAWGPGQQGAMFKSLIDQWAASAERITAISLATELVEGFARGELLIEVAPSP